VTDTVTLGAMCWQIYFISFASISSFVLFNIMVSVLIVALNQETQVSLDCRSGQVPASA
jgi:hypothetical protein